MEDKDMRKLLEEDLEVSKKSYNILRKMRRDSWIGRLFTVVKWLVILGALTWAYTQVEPIIQQLIVAWDSAEGVIDNIKQLPGFGD